MANPNTKPVSEADRTKARIEARKARENRDFQSRGNRPLTDRERYNIDNLQKAAKACDLAVAMIREGKPVNPELLELTFQVGAAFNRSF